MLRSDTGGAFKYKRDCFEFDLGNKSYIKYIFNKNVFKSLKML